MSLLSLTKEWKEEGTGRKVRACDMLWQRCQT